MQKGRRIAPAPFRYALLTFDRAEVREVITAGQTHVITLQSRVPDSEVRHPALRIGEVAGESVEE